MKLIIDKILNFFNKRKIIVLFVLCVFAGLFIYINNPIYKINNFIKNGDYRNAISIYNEKIYNTKNEEKYNRIFNNYVVSVYEMWETDAITYKSASNRLSTIEKIKNTDLSKRCIELKQYISIEGEGEEYLESAKSAEESNDYLHALFMISKIDSTYSKYEEAKNTYDICLNYLLKAVSNPKTVEECELYISLLEQYYEVVKENSFMIQMKELENQLITLKEIKSIINKASNLYDLGKYNESFIVVEEGIKKYPLSSELKESLEALRNMYIVTISQQVKEKCENKEYDTALMIIETALNEYHCSEFKELKESVKEQKNLINQIVNNIKNKFTALSSSWNNENFDVKKTATDAGTYIIKSGEKILLGDYSEENVTILSMGGNIIASIANLDVLFDIRDLVYDVQHYKDQEYFVARIATDVVVLLPVVGVIKYFDYIDDIKDGVKTANNVMDQVTDAGKTAEQTAEVISNTKKSESIAEAVDNAKDVGNITDSLNDTNKQYEKITTINQKYDGMKLNGIKFSSKKLQYSDGRLIEGVFPIFKSKFDFNLSNEFFKSSSNLHINKANAALKEQIESNWFYRFKFNKEQLEDIANGITPNGYTWHHSEVEGLLQLVSTEVHDAVKHTGGMSLWGKGY